MQILVNTCDKYSVLWKIFLEHNSRYLNLESLRVNINNEEVKLDFRQKINFISTARGKKKFPMSNWSDHLRTALQTLECDYILLIQDDYFLTTDLKTINFEEMCHSMIEHDIGCLHLSPYVPATRNRISADLKLQKQGRYTLNTQLAIWDRKYLISLLPENWNVWRWELIGHWRHNLKRHAILDLQDGSIKYFAAIKDGGYLPDISSYMSETHTKEIKRHFDVYSEKSKVIEKFRTIIKTFRN